MIAHLYVCNKLQADQQGKFFYKHMYMHDNEADNVGHEMKRM